MDPKWEFTFFVAALLLFLYAAVATRTHWERLRVISAAWVIALVPLVWDAFHAAW